MSKVAFESIPGHCQQEPAVAEVATAEGLVYGFFAQQLSVTSRGHNATLEE